MESARQCQSEAESKIVKNMAPTLSSSSASSAAVWLSGSAGVIRISASLATKSSVVETT